ncbi:MAG: hypothetical protein ACP5SI_05730, partial [Chloroflexia bacterium]
MHAGWKWLLVLTTVVVVAVLGTGVFFVWRALAWPSPVSGPRIAPGYPGMCGMGAGVVSGCG